MSKEAICHNKQVRDKNIKIEFRDYSYSFYIRGYTIGECLLRRTLKSLLSERRDIMAVIWEFMKLRRVARMASIICIT